MRQDSSKNATYIGLFATLIMIGAFIKIPVPILPFTLQYLFVCLSALLLGAKYASLSVIIYVALGLIGLPIFTAGGGLSYIFFPTFGYLLGFILSAFIIGIISSKTTPNIKNYIMASIIGLLALHIVGIPYYYIISHYVIKNTLTFKEIFFFCFVYTFPADFLLSLLAAKIALKLKPLINRKEI